MTPHATLARMNVLVIDVGGSHVKLAVSGIDETRRFDSTPEMSANDLMDQIKISTVDWKYDVVSLGIPAICGPRGAVEEPGNLGPGWIDFDFPHAFGKPVRVVNDAALQALGAYDGGRMLFLGVGTGLGATLIADRVVVPLELGAMRNIDGSNREYYGIRLGKQNMEKIGEAQWNQLAIDAILMFKAAFIADYVVIGGGHASQIHPLPDGVRRGGNDDAFTGGFRLWEEQVEPHDRPPSTAFRVVQ